MSGPKPSALFHLFSAAIFDQVILSGANLAAGLLLIRYSTDTDYGLFVLVQSALTLLVTAQGAWLSQPIATVAMRQPPQIKRRMIGALESSQRRFLRWAAFAALAVPVIGYAAHVCNGLVAIVIAGGIFAGWATLQREYLRSVLLMYSRPQTLLAVDGIYVGLLVAGVAAAVFAAKAPVVWALLALIVSAWVGGAAARLSLNRDPGLVGGDAGPVWREIRSLGVWSAVGALIYWVFSQSYNYVLASRLDLGAVTAVNAARLLLMPAIVLTVGVKSLLMPSAAAWLAEFGLNRLLRRLGMFIACLLVLDALYFITLWLFRDWVTQDLLHKTIADRDRLLVLWAMVALLGLVRDVLQCATLALRRYQYMAWLTAASAVVSLSLMWAGIGWWGPAGALIGQVAGESVSLAGVILLLWRPGNRLYLD